MSTLSLVLRSIALLAFILTVLFGVTKLFTKRPTRKAFELMVVRLVNVITNVTIPLLVAAVMMVFVTGAGLLLFGAGELVFHQRLDVILGFIASKAIFLKVLLMLDVVCTVLVCIATFAISSDEGKPLFSFLRFREEYPPQFIRI